MELLLGTETRREYYALEIHAAARKLLAEVMLVQAGEGAAEARTLQGWLDGLGDPTMHRIAHYTYGFNPGVKRFTGRVAEDERVFGVFDFGFGGWMDRPAESHFDGVITAPTVVADGVEVERDGKFTHPELADLCRHMGVPGY